MKRNNEHRRNHVNRLHHRSSIRALLRNQAMNIISRALDYYMSMAIRTTLELEWDEKKEVSRALEDRIEELGERIENIEDEGFNADKFRTRKKTCREVLERLDS